MSTTSTTDLREPALSPTVKVLAALLFFISVGWAIIGLVEKENRSRPTVSQPTLSVSPMPDQIKANKNASTFSPAPRTFWVKSEKLVADDVVQFNLTIVDRTDIIKFCDELAFSFDPHESMFKHCTNLLNQTIREGMQRVCEWANESNRILLPIWNSTADTMSLLLPVTIPKRDTLPPEPDLEVNFGSRTNKYQARTLIATKRNLRQQFTSAGYDVTEGNFPTRLLQFYGVQPPCTDMRCDGAHPYLHDCVEENGDTIVLRYSVPTRINPDRIVYERNSFRLADPGYGLLCVQQDLGRSPLVYDVETSCGSYKSEEIWPGMILSPKTDPNCSKLPKPDQVDEEVAVDLSIGSCDFSGGEQLVQYYCDENNGNKTAVYCPFANITVGSGASEETSPCPEFPFYVKPGYVFYRNGEELLRVTTQMMKVACEQRAVVGIKL